MHRRGASKEKKEREKEKAKEKEVEREKEREAASAAALLAKAAHVDVDFVAVATALAHRRQPSGFFKFGHQQPEGIVAHERALDVALQLSALHLSSLKIFRALQGGDVEVLTPEVLIVLLRSLPAPEEEERLKAFHGDISKLPEIERYYAQLLALPRVTSRIEALLWTSVHAGIAERIRWELGIFRRAAEQLVSSRSFARMLDLLESEGVRLDPLVFKGIGHLAGGADVALAELAAAEGGGQGRQLSHLLWLSGVRVAAGGRTLLHVVLDKMMRERKKGANIEDIPRELDSVAPAAQLSLQKVAHRLEELRWGVGIVDKEIELSADSAADEGYRQVLERFVVPGRKELKSLEELLSTTMGALNVLSMFFGTGRGKDPQITLMEIFSDVRTFFYQFEEVLSDLEREPLLPPSQFTLHPPPLSLPPAAVDPRSAAAEFRPPSPLRVAIHRSPLAEDLTSGSERDTGSPTPRSPASAGSKWGGRSMRSPRTPPRSSLGGEASPKDPTRTPPRSSLGGEASPKDPPRTPPRSSLGGEASPKDPTRTPPRSSLGEEAFPGVPTRTPPRSSLGSKQSPNHPAQAKDGGTLGGEASSSTATGGASQAPAGRTQAPGEGGPEASLSASARLQFSRFAVVVEEPEDGWYELQEGPEEGEAAHRLAPAGPSVSPQGDPRGGGPGGKQEGHGASTGGVPSAKVASPGGPASKGPEPWGEANVPVKAAKGKYVWRSSELLTRSSSGHSSVHAREDDEEATEDHGEGSRKNVGTPDDKEPTSPSAQEGPVLYSPGGYESYLTNQLAQWRREMMDAAAKSREMRSLGPGLVDNAPGRAGRFPKLGGRSPEASPQRREESNPTAPPRSPRAPPTSSTKPEGSKRAEPGRPQSPRGQTPGSPDPRRTPGALGARGVDALGSPRRTPSPLPSAGVSGSRDTSRLGGGSKQDARVVRDRSRTPPPQRPQEGRGGQGGFRPPPQPPPSRSPTQPPIVDASTLDRDDWEDSQMNLEKEFQSMMKAAALGRRPS